MYDNTNRLVLCIHDDKEVVQKHLLEARRQTGNDLVVLSEDDGRIKEYARTHPAWAKRFNVFCPAPSKKMPATLGDVPRVDFSGGTIVKDELPKRLVVERGGELWEIRIVDGGEDIDFKRI